MSSTLKIDGSFVTDPIRIAWQPLRYFNNQHIGAKTQSKFNSVIFTFPPLTTAQYNTWLTVCDDNADHLLFMPARCDAVFATDPGAYDAKETIGTTFEGVYRLHFLGSRHSSGVYIYDTRIKAYLVREPATP